MRTWLERKKKRVNLLHSHCHRKSVVCDMPLSLDLTLLDHDHWPQGRDRMTSSAAMPCPKYAERLLHPTFACSRGHQDALSVVVACTA